MTEPSMNSSALAVAPSARITRAQRIAFTLAITVGSRAIYLRDWTLGRIPRILHETPGLTLTPLTIPSGKNRLDAVYAAPDSKSARAAVLICHGIGEVVSQWVPIQRLLAAQGVASLVFDYSGYGNSTGRPDPAQLEQDAIASFIRLRDLTSLPASLLGFSLGTGIVAAILGRVAAHRLVLCAAFTSFRAATRRVGIPPFLFPLVPPVWDSQDVLRTAVQPILIVHSTRDSLFPVAMAKSLAGFCGPQAQLLIVDALRHNEPFYRPTQTYWNPIASFLAAPGSDRADLS
jgi:uncharacterized protein